jgi:hypothetical protein
MPEQTSNAITAETWGKNEKEDWPKHVSEIFGEPQRNPTRK